MVRVSDGCRNMSRKLGRCGVEGLDGIVDWKLFRRGMIAFERAYIKLVLPEHLLIREFGAEWCAINTPAIVLQQETKISFYLSPVL